MTSYGRKLLTRGVPRIKTDTQTRAAGGGKNEDDVSHSFQQSIQSAPSIFPATFASGVAEKQKVYSCYFYVNFSIFWFGFPKKLINMTIYF